MFQRDTGGLKEFLLYFFPRQFNSNVRSDGREGDNEIYLIVVDFIFHMNAFFLSNHLIYQLLKNWFLISRVLFYVDEVSGWWFGVWNFAKSMMVT